MNLWVYFFSFSYKNKYNYNINSTEISLKQLKWVLIDQVTLIFDRLNPTYFNYKINLKLFIDTREGQINVSNLEDYLSVL